MRPHARAGIALAAALLAAAASGLALPPQGGGAPPNPPDDAPAPSPRPSPRATRRVLDVSVSARAGAASRPLEGAEVTLFVDDYTASKETGDDGTASFQFEAEGTTATVRVIADGFAAAQRQVALQGARQTYAVVLAEAR